MSKQHRGPGLRGRWSECEALDRLCPQSDDLSITHDRWWEAPGYSVGLRRVVDTLLAVVYRLGPIDCHRE